MLRHLEERPSSLTMFPCGSGFKTIVDMNPSSTHTLAQLCHAVTLSEMWSVISLCYLWPRLQHSARTELSALIVILRAKSLNWPMSFMVTLYNDIWTQIELD